MKVLLLSKYPRMGASSRLRSLQYLPALADEGIEVTVSSLFDDEYLRELYEKGRRSKVRSAILYLKRLAVLLTVFRYDVVWIEKEIFPYFPAIFERLLSLVGVKYVVDYDDAIFHNYDLAGNRWIRTLLGRKIDTVMSHAVCVIAGNDYLADRARTAGAKRVEVIPTVVDHTRYFQAAHSGVEQLVIGWIGSPSTQGYVVDIQDALRAVFDKTGARLMLVGATNDITDELAGIPVEVVAWSEELEAEYIAKMDVGIMPLVGGPWEKGKCGYKLIQYMASGVPVVASPVGVNVEIVDGCGCGRLAQSTDEWAASLMDVLTDHKVRGEFGCAGRQAVENRYSLQRQAPVLAAILKSATR
ncbi:glycosyltransferase family 4 protein [Marinobacter sp.]|uniref:glycosyltransferase family 4 protein n=1 Tax=Marinobacter sp. TaxID=50741 RepID=UPI003A91124B